MASLSVEEITAELQRLQRCLCEALQAEHFCEDVTPPPEAFGWSESQFRKYFEAGGGAVADITDAIDKSSQPGGGRRKLAQPPKRETPRGPTFPLSVLKMPQRGSVASFDFVSTCKRYTDAMLGTGIAAKPFGLFPPHDPLLASLVAAGYKPFTAGGLVKCADGTYCYLPATNAWVESRDQFDGSLCQDIRLFYEARRDGWTPRIFAALRYGYGACGMPASADDYVHGGAAETTLDEITAEAAKHHFFPEATTSHFECKLKKKLAPNVTYLVEARHQKTLTEGLKVELLGRILDASAFDALRDAPDAMVGDYLLATATSTMVNLAAIPGAFEARYGE